ncbi:glycoside hydrolase [Hesseltinella vesiculosa]|uniref:beta-glucosidase n=1 Tax=Hesseltinella vesiculosa TaxID=101127 RepID=A0A1X2G7I6_9FUNG|nr:glycoside hydrolase [Hesseltinella vesiculosa]
MRVLSLWDEAYAKAEVLVDKMSLAQKVNLTTGVGWGKDACVGNTGSSDNPYFPSLCLQDGPVGVRFADMVSVNVAGVNAAASFDKKAIRRRGQVIASEFKQKGVHVQLGPAMNIMRTPDGGRNWECFSEDPYLTGIAAVETIQGIQSQGVHWIGNEQEVNREQIKTIMDDRTLHEIYAWPFKKSVEGGVASVMCSYNKVGDHWACEDDASLNQVLKQEFGFRGFVMSDWLATHSTAKSVNAGLDMTMPGGITFESPESHFGQRLLNAVGDSQVPEERIRDMALRIVAAWYKEGTIPAVNLHSFLPHLNHKVNVMRNHNVFIRELGAASTVLLRNNDDLLPLSNRLDSLAIIGEDAGPDSQGLNSAPDGGANRGTLGIGWGSGAVKFTYLITPLEGIAKQAGDTKILSSLSNQDLYKAEKFAREADIAIVFANANSGEEFITVEGNRGDRNDLLLWNNGNELIQTVANNNNNTVVVIHSVGAVEMPWLDHPNIKAIVWAGVPGQESGHALADVLYGEVNPSGRLPYTIGKRWEDYSGRASQTDEAVYHEKLAVGYRWFDQQNIQPNFEFGFGLSYTKFGYRNVDTDTQQTSTQNPRVEISVDIENTGDVDGAEVPQLYLTFPDAAGEPPKLLRGFEKVFIQKGDKAHVTFPLSGEELSYWDSDVRNWIVPSGTFTAHVGASSRDIRGSVQFQVV